MFLMGEGSFWSGNSSFRVEVEGELRADKDFG